MANCLLRACGVQFTFLGAWCLKILRNMAESEHSLEKSKGQMGDRVPNVEVAKKGEQSSQELPTTSANK